MSISAEMVRNIIDTSFDRFDPLLVDRAKNRVIDAVGCALAGVHAPGCAMVLDLLKEWGGKEESTILGLGGRLPVHAAAMVNSIFTRSYDFEPTGAFIEGKSTPAHISGTTVPVALAVAEQAGATGKDLITALIVGDDLASRVAAASQLNIDSGWDSTGTVNVLGAAAIAGKLWHLDEQQMLNALGIAINQMSGTFQNIFDYTHAFKLPQGLAAQSGIFGAALARKGFVAPRDPLMGKHGYFSLYCRSYKPEILTMQLGESYYAGDTFKPFPCCRSNHAAIECALTIMKDHELKAGEIDEIIVSVTPTAKDFAVGQAFQIGEVPQVNAAFSLQYTVACACLRGSVGLEDFTEPRITDPRIMDLVPKIRLAATLPSHMPLGANVKIRTRKGREYEATVAMPRGSDTLTPLSQEEKRAKFLSNAAFSGLITPTAAEKVLDLLENLEQADTIEEAVNYLHR